MKRLLATLGLLILFLSGSVIINVPYVAHLHAGGWTQRFTDAFTRADNVDLGANWDSGYTGFNNLQIVSNAVRSTVTAALNVETVNTATYGPTRAQVTITSFSGTDWLPRLYVRASAPASLNGYEVTAGDSGFLGSTIRVRRFDAGAATGLTTDSSVTWVAGDVMMLEAVGSTISVYRNGSFVVSTTDATYSTGRAGVGISNDTSTANTVVDDFFIYEFVNDCGRLSMLGVGC